MRILLVDDEPEGLKLRKIVMERHGHQVATALDDTSARMLFAEFVPEAVILDLRLPRVEQGIALLKEFRTAAAGTRIVVLSGYEADLDGRPEKALADEILGKPVRMERLIAALTSAPSRT